MKLLAPADTDSWAIEQLGLSSAEAASSPARTRRRSPRPGDSRGADVTAADDVLVDPADSTKLLTASGRNCCAASTC